MPKGVYRRTDEMKRNISKSAKERCKKYKHPMLGRKHTQEAKDKVSIANKGKISPMKGKHPSKETRKKMSEAGKIKIFSEEHKKNLREAKKRSTTWNKGLTKETDERVKNLSESLKEHKLSEETKRKIGEANKISRKGMKFSDEHIRHMRDVWTPEKKRIAREKWLKENNPNWNPNREEIYAPYGENFYNKKIRSRKWNLQNSRDMLTGTMLDLNKQPAYHHIDYCKSNDDPDNHCFLSINNHTRITGYQQNPIKSEKYKRILQENTLALKNGQIPKNWSPLNKELFRQEKLKQLDLSSYII